MKSSLRPQLAKYAGFTLLVVVLMWVVTLLLTP